MIRGVRSATYHMRKDVLSASRTRIERGGVHAQGRSCLKVRHLGPRVVLAELPTVVAKCDDGGALRQAEVVKLGQEHADVVVGVPAKSATRCA